MPVGVVGMYEVMNARSRLIRPFRTVTVYCDAPIETRGLTDADVPALVARVRDAIAMRVDSGLG